MHIAISGHQILPILERLLPFLVLKKLQALAVMAFIKHRQNAAFREKPSDRMLELVQIIRDLNIQTNRFKRERDEADKLAKLQSDLEAELKDLSTGIFS